MNVCISSYRPYIIITHKHFMILYLSLHLGVDIFCGRLQAFWLVPHSSPVRLLLHVWTSGASAHTGQTQEVSLHPGDSLYSSFISSASPQSHQLSYVSLSSRIPGKTYMIIAFLTVGTMGLSNTSLGYLNYPTQVIFKCCKLIPVMIGGVFIQGKLSS